MGHPQNPNNLLRSVSGAAPMEGFTMPSTKPTVKLMDVFYLPCLCAYPKCYTVYRSWDDSYYAETNVREVAGPSRRVSVNPDEIGCIEGVRMSCTPFFQ